MTENNDVQPNLKPSKPSKCHGPSSIPVALQFDQNLLKMQKIKNSLVNSEQDIRVAIQKHTFFPKFSNCNCSKCGALNVIKESLAHPGIYGFQTDGGKSRTATQSKRPDCKKMRPGKDSIDSFTSLVGRRPYTSPALLEEPLINHLEQKLASIFDKLSILEKKIDRNRKTKRRITFIDRGSQCPAKDDKDYHGVLFNCLYSQAIFNPSSLKEECDLEIGLKEAIAGKECSQSFQELVQQLSPTDSKEFKELLKEYQEKYKNRDKYATTVSKIPVIKKKPGFRIRTPEEDSVTARSDDTVTIGSFFDFLDKDETIENHQDKLKTSNGTLEWLTKKLSMKKKKSLVAV